MRLGSNADRPAAESGDATGNCRDAAFWQLLRGGRMTKWKGEAASYAPNLAHFVSATARAWGGAILPAAVLTGLALVPASGQTLYWDGGTVNGGNPAVDANGGPGNWNNTLTNWDTAAVAGANSAWTSGADAVFGGSAGGIVTVDAGGISAHSLGFSRSGYNVTGGTITLTGATPTIAVAFTEGATVSSVLAGTNGMTKSANGLLALAGTNTLTGGITVADGSLRLDGVNSANGANNVVRVNGGGTLIVNNLNAFGGDTAASRLVLNNGSVLAFNTGASLFTHDITVSQAGTVTLSGGTWTGNVVLNGDATLRFNGGMTVNSNLADNNGSVMSVGVTAGPSDVRFNGDLSFTGGLTVLDRAVLAGTNSYSGNTIVATGVGGTSRLTYMNAGAISANSNVQIGDADSVGQIQFGYSPAANAIVLGAGDGQFQFTGDGGFLSRSVAVDVTLALNNNAALTWGVTPGFIADGDTLYLGADTTNSNAREINLTNAIDLGAAQRTVFANFGNIADHGVLGGTLSGAGGGLQVVGNGALELRGTNTYTGPTEVQSALMLGSAGALPGGIGVAGGLSNLQINGIGGTFQNDGIVALTAGSGDFLRGVGTGSNQLQWLADGGFTAVGVARTVSLGNGAALTWGQGGFVGDGSRLVFGGGYGNAAINFENTIDLGTLDRTIEVNNVGGSGRALNLNGVISGSGGLILEGNGEVALTALNSFTGRAVLGSEVAGSDSLQVLVTNIGNAGVAGNLGAGNTIELKAHGQGLFYSGAGESTNRDWIVGLRVGGQFFVHNNGSGALELTGNVTKDATGATNTLHLQGTFASADANSDGIADDPNLVSGIVSENSGTLDLQLNAGAWRFTGANTYTGSTLINAGTILEVDDLANGGATSSIGDSLSDAGNLIFTNNATLRYIGTGDSTDRLMTIQTGSRIESSGTGALNFTNTGVLLPRVGPGGYRLDLGGTNTDENTFAPTLTNLFAADANVANLGLLKDGVGLWALVTDNNANANAYTQNTTITAGALKLNNAGAITGGLGTASSHGVAGSIERSSMILFNSTSGTGGVLGLTAASGGFTRGLTVAGSSLVDVNGTPGVFDDDNYVHGVRWTGSGGFAAWDGTQTVNLGGAGAQVAWNAAGFVPTSRNLVLGYVTANGTVDFVNPVSFSNAARTVEVSNGTAAVDAIMSGVLSSTTTAGALVKTGAGTLALAGTNTYTGTTTVNGGILQLGNGGGTGTLGTGAVTVAAGANVAFDRNNTYTVPNTITGVGGPIAGGLIQQGTGTTILTAATNTVGATAISAGTLQINNTLVTPTVAMSGTSALTVNGTVGAAAGATAAFTGDAGAATITVNSGGTLRGAGDLGDGSDTVTLTGTLNTGVGTLNLGLGNDTLALNDGGTLTGLVDGGTGGESGNGDTLRVNTTVGRTLDSVTSGVANFESLNKQGAGTLTLTGNHGYSANTVGSPGTELEFAL